MSFKEYICQKLWEMAFEQAHAQEKIEELVPETAEHILKCRLMPDSRDVPHWFNEIKKWTDKMDGYADTKTKRGRISYSILLKECGKKISAPKLSKVVKGLEWEYNTKFNAENSESAINFTTELMKEIFYDLSQDNYDWLKIMQRITK